MTISRVKDAEFKHTLREISEKLHVVLDIDNTISTGKWAEDENRIKEYLSNFKDCGVTQDIIQFSVKMKDYKPITVLQILHPGAIEFIKWLHHELGIRISFFSSGIEERNKSFVKDFFLIALGSNEYEKIKGYVSIHSSEDLKRSTEELKLAQIKNFGARMCGNFKKDLRVTLKNSEDLSLTVLIDDDRSYICPGQEANALIASSVQIPELLGLESKSYVDREDLLRSNNIFYITGILKNALDMTLRGGSFLNNLFKLQFKEKNLFAYELIGSLEETQFHFYIDGLKELQKINPKLKFHGAERLVKHFEGLKKHCKC